MNGIFENSFNENNLHKNEALQKFRIRNTDGPNEKNLT